MPVRGFAVTHHAEPGERIGALFGLQVRGWERGTHRIQTQDALGVAVADILRVGSADRMQCPTAND